MKGTVIRRGKKWSVVLEVGRVDGKRKRDWHSGFSTKREAEEARVELLAKLQQGTYVTPSKQTVGEWLESWLEERQNIAETTRSGYRYEIERISKALGPRRLRELTPALIKGFYSELSHLAPKTIKNCHGVLHKALADAVVEGVLTRNPADHVELPRAEQPDTETWTPDELRRFLEHAETHRLHASWVLLCSTGMRRSELLGVRWSNLDLDIGKLAVVDTVVPIDNRPTLRLGETKSKRSRRVIALDERTVSVMRSHRSAQNAERMAAGPAYENLGLVFATELGGVVSPDWFTRTTKRLAKEAGVPPLAPHAAARHTWATLALSSGVHPKVVQERLGHSSISITLDRYSHVIDGMDREAAEAVAALIR